MAYYLAHPDRIDITVPFKEVTQELWLPDYGTGANHKTLKVTLSNLRKALGPEHGDINTGVMRVQLA